MGNNRILELRRHIESLILKADRPEQSEHIHNLCHSIEVLMQVEHMSIAIHGVRKDNNDDFPLDIDFD